MGKVEEKSFLCLRLVHRLAKLNCQSEWSLTEMLSPADSAALLIVIVPHSIIVTSRVVSCFSLGIFHHFLTPSPSSWSLLIIFFRQGTLCLSPSQLAAEGREP